MRKKIIFTFVFVLVHSSLTIGCVVDWLNFNSVVQKGLWPQFVNLCAKILSSPLLLPMVIADPDGGRFPKWLAMASLYANSLIWAALVLLVFTVISRSRKK